MTDVPPLTRRMLDLIDAAPTPFHAVAEVARRLEARGFSRLREEDAWSMAPGGRHYVTRNDSSLVAFVVGSGPLAEHGFRLVGAHTDSPNLRLKPVPEYSKEGYCQLAVEPYGGLLLNSWLDRDLGLAGRVVVADEAEPRLFRIHRPLCRVPQLAIHLDRDISSKGLNLDKQKHMPPVIGLQGEASQKGWFLDFLARELGVAPGAVLAHDLMLYDVVPATVSGLESEFVHAPRLDNLASCHAALEALLAAADAGAGPTRVIALYDHEEVGSTSAEGAASPFLEDALARINLACQGGAEDLHRAFARSFFVSADMAHAVHPNFSDRHEPHHHPRLGRGPVIKVNQNQRYATNAATAARFERLARDVDVTLQRYAHRSDLPCGSTIGPITAARLGMPTVDVGNPMLSMHSIRELAGSADQPAMVRVLTRLFEGAVPAA